MTLEGELRVGLQLHDGHVARIGVTSSRPDVGRTLLQDRTRTEAVAAVPQLFSVCAHAQAAAATLACAAAAGQPPAAGTLANCGAAVDAERVREYAWRALLEAPQSQGQAPADDAVAAARAAMNYRCPAPAAAATDDASRRIALAVFGMAAGEWLALPGLHAFDGWADTGGTATARWIGRLRDDDACDGVPTPGAAATALLPSADHAAWIGELCAAMDADPEFTRLPGWHGAPAETGALARQHDRPLIDALLQRSSSRALARCVARLYELALHLGGHCSAALGALARPGGDGVAWVETARGLLVHRVGLVQQRIQSYRILAPTEWNFHPAGALAGALLGAPAHDLDALLRRADRLVQSLDPCVACQVVLDHA